MTHSVRVLRRARSDLREIETHLAREAPETVDELIDRLLEAIESLAELPLRGARPRNAALRARGYRFLVEEPYLVFYRIKGRQVRIHRVLHASRSYHGLL